MFIEERNHQKEDIHEGTHFMRDLCEISLLMQWPSGGLFPLMRYLSLSGKQVIQMGFDPPYSSSCRRLQTNRNNSAKQEFIRKQIIPFCIKRIAFQLSSSRYAVSKSGLNHKKRNMCLDYSFKADTNQIEPDRRLETVDS